MNRLRVWCRSSVLLFISLTSLCFPFGLAQETRTSVPVISSTQTLKHPKSIDDLDAIGTRNISGGRLGNWYSLERETKLGQDYTYEIEGFTKPLRDPFIAEYVNRVGQTLVRNSDAKVPFTIKVIDSEEVNAFALPGGFMYVTSGLLAAAENEAELAGIMAHEVAHVAARHATRQLTRSQFFDLASIPLIAFGGGLVVAARETVGSLGTMKFSRNYEAEADYLGVEYVYKAGYDPTGLVSMLERLRQEDKKQSSVSRAFSSHPQTGDRILKIQAEIARILPARPTYLVSTSDFDEIHLRLLSRTIHLDSDAGRPTLRRRSATDEVPSRASDEGPGPNQP